MELKSIKTKIRYDRESRAASYKVGDKERMLELAKSKGKSKKLTRKWKGPFEVVEVISEQNLRIKACSKNGKSSIVHKNLLKRSYDRSKFPEEVPKYRSRADQTLKKAPNPSKCRYRVITANGETESASTALNESAVNESNTDSEPEESDSAESMTQSLVSGEDSDDAALNEEAETPVEFEAQTVSIPLESEDAHNMVPTEVVKKRGRPKGTTKKAMET